MVSIKETLVKRRGFEGDVDNSEFTKFIKDNVEDERVDALLEYVNGGNLKKIAKQYHIAASRISNLYIHMAETFHDNVLMNRG